MPIHATKPTSTAELASLFDPLHDRVIVTQRLEEEITPYGLIIPESVRKVANQGTVVAVGPGRLSSEQGFHRAPMSVKVGDEILWEQFNSAQVKIQGVDFYVLRDTDIYAIIRSKPKEQP